MIIDIDKNTHININIATDTKLALFYYMNMKNESKNILPLSLYTNCANNLYLLYMTYDIYICIHNIIDMKIHNIPINILLDDTYIIIIIIYMIT